MGKDKPARRAAALPKEASKAQYLCGKRILPEPISGATDIVQLIDSMDAYNGGRLRAACHLLQERYSQSDVTIGLSLAGALTPAGLGPSAIIPLMNHGFVDWITATGANMYHDIHFAFDLPMFRGSHQRGRRGPAGQGRHAHLRYSVRL